jgi:methylated-DNA-[protein]-cysteine S-methyltransferase
MEANPLRFAVILSPLGPLRAVAGPEGLRNLGFRSDAKGPPPGDMFMIGLEEELRDYFAGNRRKFSIPLHLQGTPFQKAVWDSLLRIPYGQVRTYGQVAAALGRPGGARAVGQAARSNPVGIIVPCHRVVASGGLGGYSGADPANLALKRSLLALEGALPGGLRGDVR